MDFSFEPKLKRALNKAYLKKPVAKEDLVHFRDQLLKLADHLDPTQPEEHAKNLLATFLRATFYSEGYQVNVQDRIDLTIAKGGVAQVLFETKKPGKTTDMMSLAQPNTKALQQILFYFLEERLGGNNLEIKTLVVTDVDRWFVFDARDFEALATKDKQLIKDYESFRAGRLVFDHTGDFYTQVAKPWFDKKAGALASTYIDLADLIRLVRVHPDRLDVLAPLYKLLSPAHLLKQPFQNDSNTLDKNFYGELLYWMGLEEAKEGSKAVIRRPTSPKAASLVELIVDRLEMDDKLAPGESAWDVAMELALLWVNRLLFLKLLESQLATYHQNDPAYRFMAPGDLKDFDDLFSLFFGVLAVRPGDRREKYATRWARVPYLNSSLFEQSETEKRVLSIDRLDNHAVLPVWGRSVLKAEDGKRATGGRPTLEYLLSFLDAFDFSSEGTGEVQDSGKTLINASVLGLIFEKINGYKEGAFFTPGYITQYMAHQSVRSALVTKFNQVEGWDCADFTELTNRLSRVTKTEELRAANAVVNTLKILDPAVGSGHFLVSVLNELIAAKSELGLLMDGQGKLLGRYQAVVENDELFLLDQEGEFVTYHSPFRANEAQRVWETVFHEKKALIEGCLFGVDINPNSVQICKLRLWIELLKHAFYTPATDYQELETLPNLDIKIRSGNSLVSRYSLEVPLNKIGNGDGGLMSQYLELVKAYQETPDKRTKAQIEEHIGSIKARIVADLEETRPLKRKWELARDRLAALTQDELFGLTDKERKDRDKKKKPVEAELKALTAQLDDESRNPIYANSFEWRFEFPEVLDPETGAFVGFDVVIGNPPYIRQEELTPFKRYFEGRYEVYDGVADIYVYFVERAMNLLVAGGWFGYILPNKWLRASYGYKLRTWIKGQHWIRSLIDFGDLPVFDAATTYPCLLFLAKTPPQPAFQALTVSQLEDLDLEALVTSDGFEVDVGTLDSEGWSLVEKRSAQLLQRLLAWGTPLGEAVSGKIYYGIKTGLNEAFVIDRVTRDRLVAEDPKCEGLLKPFLAGRDVRRYEPLETDKSLLFLPKGWTKAHCPEGTIPWAWLQKEWPSLANHFRPHEEKARARSDQGDFWWELRACDYYDAFQIPRTVVPAIVNQASFALSEGIQFSNDKTSIIGSTSRLLLGILNSGVSDFFLKAISSTKQGGYFEQKPMYLERIPLPPALFPPSAEGNATGALPPEAPEIESLVTRILAAKKADPAADTQALEDLIDQLVYRLYGLTDEEIAIVEGK